MKTSLVVFFLAVIAGGTVALNVRQSGVRAAGCDCGTTSFDCASHFDSIANDGQAQNCCLSPTNFPTDALKFKVTRKNPTPNFCGKDNVAPIDTSGSTCDIGTDMEPQPDVGVFTCWNGGTAPAYHTVTIYMQRISDATDGGLRVGVYETVSPYEECATLWGYFDSSQTALCSNCTNPAPNCNDGMCHNC